ncbi:hypothetical protein BDV28DRAFT_147206 [Aspergillus coremiiformis]|uniref:Cyclase-domain-containing protein n=1 Tax=Aspergillus coremiiformis TaxID=138285 RepID=A0A5N6ZB08_9EURO|nr:hypothetical protein BDV28DRAFT_147206 [Aspergillus coremiiformis]
MSSIPSFDDLPPVPGYPHTKCSWGVFDTDGQKDLYGILNFVSIDVVKSAAAEIQNGISISLNWPLGSHFQHAPSGLSYNGFTPTVETLESNNHLPTLNHWHTRGGLVGRGVLIDFQSYAIANGIHYSPFSPFRITVADLRAVPSHQATTFRPGDILIIRFGFTEALRQMTEADQLAAIATNTMKSHLVYIFFGVSLAAPAFWGKRHDHAPDARRLLKRGDPSFIDTTLNTTANVLSSTMGTGKNMLDQLLQAELKSVD